MPENASSDLPVVEQPKPSTKDPAQDSAETDWKAEARKWEQRAKENKAKLDEASPKLAEYAAWEEASKSELDRANEQTARWQTEATKWRSSTVTARIEALAAPDFAYPADAVGKLDPAKYLDASGLIDEALIKADLDALLSERPNWRRGGTDSPGGRRLPAPNNSQGKSANPAPVTPAEEFASLLRQKLS